MDDYQQDLAEETAYLAGTVAVIERELASEAGKLLKRKKTMVAARRDMWENGVHFAEDFDRLAELNQYLSELNHQTANYQLTSRRVEEYRRIIASPYFGRFDFRETGADSRCPVYIGLHNVIDSASQRIYVHDWRAPVSSVFYRYEPGQAEYRAPSGVITGEVGLKRQYKIADSRLDYFFDCSVRINDEILQRVLSRHASPKMRSIVETIQREQDIIIRDTANELLIVQGVAGSGKTAVVLHRVAFLLYEGLHSNLRSNNVLIISPNAVFGQYIAEVLPELGEENVRQTTFHAVARAFFGGRFTLETREMQLESLLNSRRTPPDNVLSQAVEFKGSRAFVRILDRLLWHYGHRVIPFADVYYHGRVLATRQRLKNRFLDNKTGIPMARQLKRLEGMILEKVRSLRKDRLKRIERVVANSEEHQLEVKSFSRLLSIRETRSLTTRIHAFTDVDYWEVYKMLFTEGGLLLKLAAGLPVPENVGPIIGETRRRLERFQVDYEDCAPLLYLMLRIEGAGRFTEIRQVLIDEAQDYHPIHYEVFKLLFKDSRFTVLGDDHQMIEKETGVPFYEHVAAILNKGETVTLFLNRTYRSFFEISRFTHRLLGSGKDLAAFERHEAEPAVVFADDAAAVGRLIAGDIATYLGQGYQSVAVICKTLRETREVYRMLNGLTSVRLVEAGDAAIGKGALVIPSFLARGLEFDVVLVFGVNQANYATDMDRKLLYLACTRALHRLVLYGTGQKSPLVPG